MKGLGLALVVGIGALALAGDGGSAESRPPKGKPRPSVDAPPEVIARVAAALATDDPKKMRAEAAKLRREGWDREADDLELAAADLEELLRQERQPTGGTDPKPGGTEPKPAPAPKGPRNLVQGMTGQDVKEWQQQLIRDGYSLKSDGIFGPITTTLTKTWQAERGLKPDGIVGPATRAAIGSRPSGVKPGTAAPAPAPAAPAPAAPAPAAPKPPTVAPAARRLLKRGMQGNDVREWQTLLVMDGYVVKVDGIFGEKTEAATLQWQRDRGLKADGIVGPQTLGAVGKPKLPTASPVQPPLTVNPDSWRTLKQGMSGTDVKEWQLVLAKYGYVVATDGVFGPKTHEATKEFQTAYGLTPDGVVGKNTRAKLAQLASPRERVAGDVASVEMVRSELGSPPPFLLGPEESDPPSTEDETAEQLAARLAEHLFDVAPGGEDRELVRRFQRSQGLNDTGVYGPATARAIALLGTVPPRPREWPSKKLFRAKEQYKAAMREHARRDPERASAWVSASNV